MEALPEVDWTLAARVGRSLVPAGPRLEAAELAQLVAGLRGAAQRATPLVAAASQLPGPAAADVLIVDRASWIASNAAMASAMLAGVRQLQGQSDEPEGRASLSQKVSARVAGAEIAAVFSWVATRILGQFDPFGTPNRLLLVAPNMVATERAMGVLPDDFRLWVCLHEETHRFQFGAAPWLRGHLLALFDEVLQGRSAPLSSWRPGPRSNGLVDLVIGPEQRSALEQITAVMSLMEGHADVIMDLAAAGEIATVVRLRELFEQRRDAGGLAGLIGKLLGLNLKREQYREGAVFCRAVIAAIGIAGLNQAFESRGLLPTLAELRDPPQWLHRMGA